MLDHFADVETMVARLAPEVPIYCLRPRGFVETAEQGALLAELKCDMVQGHLYSHALAAQGVTALLQPQDPKVVVIRSKKS